MAQRNGTHPKPQMEFRWLWRNLAVGYGVLVITVTEGHGVTRDEYFVRPQGDTWEFTKMERLKGAVAEYRVGLRPIPHCGCEGFRYRGACRHTEAMAQNQGG